MTGEGHPIGLAMGICVISVWLGMGWLAWLMGIASALMVLSTIRFSRPRPVPQGGPKEPEEVLTPVVYQDVGEAPYLYPPNYSLKIKTPWNSQGHWEDVMQGVASGLKIFRRLTGRQEFAQRKRMSRAGPAWRMK